MIPRNQHYVWQHYLNAWTDKKGQLLCLRDKKVFQASPKRIMAERDFYKLEPLNQADKKALEWYFDDADENIKNLIFDFIYGLNELAEKGDTFRQLHGIPEHIKLKAASTRTVAGEMYNEMVERTTLPILQRLREKRGEFLQTTQTAIQFYHYLAHQYLRTKKIRESLRNSMKLKIPFNYENLWGWICFGTVFQLGSNLFVSKDEYEIVFLTNESEIEFITGDQPIINIAADVGGELKAPDELIFYYPVTPNLAVLYVERSYGIESQSLAESIVQALNDYIAINSYENLVATSLDTLKNYHDKTSVNTLAHRTLLARLRSVD